MNANFESLAEALPREVERNQELLAQYQQIGPAGMFGAGMISADLAEAARVMASGDVVGMIRVYQKLQGNK